ncbi:TPA: hypothetical protein O4F91_004428 [Vibrio alginolyticus]|nr:hypothetical protein [Vibrio alginolyticus]HCZ9057213.1 hypothetical protein [Vibrio alginolyticus]
MIPAAIKLILKHFDEIDQIVSSKMVRKRPWSEPSLTSLLADLLDEDVQEEENIKFTIKMLNDELKGLSAPYSLDLNIETHQYATKHERYVGQSDIGIIIEYVDNFFPSKSFTRPWLLQAKKVMPTSKNPVVYDETSAFSSMDKGQNLRIKKLTEVIGEDFIRYMLYCPRSCNLDKTTRAKLAYLRNSQLSANIFDYALGFEIKDSLDSPESTLDSGIFISIPECDVNNLASVHAQILDPCTPLSWFIVSHFTHGLYNVNPAMLNVPFSEGIKQGRYKKTKENKSWVEGLVRGDVNAVSQLFEELEIEELPEISMLPSHTITVTVTAGIELDDDLVRIRGIDV